MRKGDRADGQKAKVMGSFTTEGEGEERMQRPLMQFCGNFSYNKDKCGLRNYKSCEGEY